MIFSLLPANLLSMRSLNVSRPLQGTKQTFSTNSSPTQSQTNTTVQIPVESSNQALAKVIDEQKQEQGSSKKSKWYQGKWKYFTGLGPTAGMLGNESSKNSISNKEPIVSNENMLQDELIKKDNYKSDQRFLNSQKAELIAPKLNSTFLKIKKLLGIQEDIHLRINTNTDNFSLNADALFLPQYNCIIINAEYSNWSPFQIIRTLVHELEHVKQIYHYPDSYKLSSLKAYQTSKIKGKKSETGEHLKAETGADASAAGFFDCPECLHEISKQYEKAKNPLLKYNPEELQSGYFTTELGYFAPKDYQPYIKRACLDGELCEGHKILGKPKTIKSQNQDDFMKYDLNHTTEYDQGYLKQKFNTLRKQKQSKLPVELFLPKSAE